MRIKSIYINNYKLFSDFKLTLPEGITVISGVNGSGKTALLELLCQLRRFLAMPCSPSVAISIQESFPFSILPRWKVKKNATEKLRIALDFSEACDGKSYEFSYMLTIGYDFLSKKVQIESESLTANGEKIVNFDKGNLSVVRDDKSEIQFIADQNLSGLVTAYHNNSKIRIFGEAVMKLYCISDIPENIEAWFENISQDLKFDASNFAAWRSFNAAAYSEKIQQIADSCKYFIHGLISLNDIQTGEGNTLKLRIGTGQNDGTYELSYAELSTGQKKLVMLYCLVGYLPNGAALFIDEPENFLSPDEIQPWLNAMNSSWEEKDTQIVVVTHNSETLNWYEDEKITFAIEGLPPYITVAASSAVQEFTLNRR